MHGLSYWMGFPESIINLDVGVCVTAMTLGVVDFPGIEVVGFILCA